MLAELTIVPLGVGEHLSEPLADVLRVIDASGLHYTLTPCGTCIEGEWDEVMGLVRQCHERMRERSRHVLTTIRIEDEAGVTDKMTRNITSLEEKLGKRLTA